MFTGIEAKLLSYVDTLPLELFSFVASFVEEVLAPIPSPTVMLAAGSFAEMQGKTLLALVPLAFIAASGKTLGALVVYFISDKAENLILNKFGKFFDLSHEDVENFGKRLGNGYQDYFLLTLFRALPFVPSVVVSVGCGILKVPLRLFIVATFLGTVVRDGIYLYVGFVGTEFLSSLITRSTSLESLVEFFSISVILGVLLYLYLRRRTQH